MTFQLVPPMAPVSSCEYWDFIYRLLSQSVWCLVTKPGLTSRESRNRVLADRCLSAERKDC